MTIDRLSVAVYEIPTDAAEADGTLTWDRTTAVVVEAAAAGRVGVGYTYGSRACATLIDDVLREHVLGAEPMAVQRTWAVMVDAIRNHGRPGICSMAISAVDTALWDLKARLLNVPLSALLGGAPAPVPIYASGGFTSYPDERLAEQLGGWVHEQRIPRVKMKIAADQGRDPKRDVARVEMAREAIGPDAELFVDANGGYSAKQSIRVSPRLVDLGVTWFEEPVSSDDLEGLRLVRQGTDIDVAAGEYGYDLVYFRRMCAAQAVDCLQVDVTRCGGFTAFMRAAAVAQSYGLEVSAHTAPSLHAHLVGCLPNLRHIEYFHDHVRVEHALFDGVPEVRAGALALDASLEGNGLTLKRAAAGAYAA